MPHCVVEHSSTINADDLIPLVFSGALKSELFQANGGDIKVRTSSFTNHQSGYSKIDFVHVTLRILSGRNIDQKSMLSQLVLDQLKQLSLANCSLTVEVVDIDRACYAKVVL